MAIQLRERENRDRIASVKNQHANEIERLIRDLRGQVVQQATEEMEVVEVIHSRAQLSACRTYNQSQVTLDQPDHPQLMSDERKNVSGKTGSAKPS
jgi:hypothetical protein